MLNATYNNQDSLTINEVSSLLDVSTSTLRNWERILSIPVARNAKGNRIYNKDIIDIFFEVKKLLVTGKTLEDTKMLMGQASTSCNSSYNNQPKVEVIQEDNKEEDNLNLALISRYESKMSLLTEKNEVLNRRLGQLEGEISKYNEIMALKDSIIIDKDNLIAELRGRLNKPWWAIWVK